MVIKNESKSRAMTIRADWYMRKDTFNSHWKFVPLQWEAINKLLRFPVTWGERLQANSNAPLASSHHVTNIFIKNRFCPTVSGWWRKTCRTIWWRPEHSNRRCATYRVCRGLKVQRHLNQLPAWLFVWKWCGCVRDTGHHSCFLSTQHRCCAADGRTLEKVGQQLLSSHWVNI